MKENSSKVNPDFELRIEELVLRGFRLSERYEISAAIESELKTLFSNQDFEKGLNKNISIENINGKQFTAGSNPRDTGKSAGTAIFEGIVGKLNDKESQ